jgi:hypothetical protein
MPPEPTRTFERPHRTPAMRLFNGLGRLLRRCGWRRSLDAGRILDAACRRTGLNDFGELDVREPLERLVASLERENALTPLGRLLIRHEFVQFAAARLGVVAALKEHPEIRHEPVSRPLFVLGLPRSGSTLLQRLLAQDPDSRPLFPWELLRPTPGPAPDRVRQIRRTRRALSVLTRYLAPRMQAMHPTGAEEPGECCLLLMNTFRWPTFRRYGSCHSYLEWLDGQGEDGLLRLYEDYRRQLQLLQWRCPPRRWVLKTPSHAYGLGALLRLFPDACVVQTHRDLAHVLPSTCSLRATTRGIHADDVDPRRIAAESAVDLRARFLDPALRAREAHPGRVHDVTYRELVGDPVGTARAIYARFGLPWEAEVEGRMQAWLAANPQGKHGRHRYSLEQFGLDRAAVAGLFPGYPQCFGLPPEAL